MLDFREALSQYSNGWRRTFGVSLLIGIGIFVVGLVGDWRDWWEGLSFLPNALTSLSGFFVGVPVALVLFSALTGAREEKVERNKLELLSDTAWKTLSDKVHAFCSDERLAALELAQGEVRSALWDIFSKCSSIPPFRPAWQEERAPIILAGVPRATLSDQDLDDLIDQFPCLADEFDKKFNPVDVAIPIPGRAGFEWLGVLRSWEVLNSYVKIQRIELGLRWLDDDIDAAIQHKMIHIANPLGEVFDYHYPEKADMATNTGIANLANYLRNVASGSKDVARRVLRENSKAPIYTISFDDYSLAAANAHMFLSNLRKLVDMAEERPGWPPKALPDIADPSHTPVAPK